MTSGCATSTAQVEKIRAQAAHERGLAYLNERQPASALVALREAVTINPAEPLYRDSLALLLLDLGQIEPALAELRKAIELDPRFAVGHFHLGVALAESRRWEDAIKSYQTRSEEHTSELQSQSNLVCRLLLEKKNARH